MNAQSHKMQKGLVSGIALLAAVIFTASDVSAATGDWPQYGFTAAGRRENTQETILTRKTVPHLVQKWRAPITLGHYSAPAVANGIVYVGSVDHDLYALDARTGVQVWNAATGGPILSSPAVADGVVYVGSGNVNAGDSRVYAFDAETGALRWSTLAGINGVMSPVTVAKGLVYAGSDTGATAISAKTGIVKWTVTNIHTAMGSAPAVSDGIAYFANLAGELCAFDAGTGASLWSQHLTPSMPAFTSAPATYKGSVFVSDGSRLWAFDAKTGQMRWANGDPYAPQSGIAVAGGHIFLAGLTGILGTYDAATGALKWTDTGQPRDMAVPALANGVIYLGGAYGNSSTLSAYDTHTGKRLWQDQATAGFNTPTVSNGMVYVGKDYGFNAYGLP